MTATRGPSERRFKLTLHYDGAGFHGWQVQPDARTVQQELEAAIERLTTRPTSVMAAGRTDAGVHATGQVASALVPARWRADTLERALNAVLPPDIWVASVEEVALDFHARYDAIARGYTYRVGTQSTARSPFLQRWCWPLCESLDRDRLNSAAARFIGEHSFRAFAKSGQPERGEQCVVMRADWSAWGDVGVALAVSANRFLHHMVRYMVGTMVDVARGRRPLDDVAALLGGEASLETSPPAPAEGLCLTHVWYDAKQERDRNPEMEIITARPWLTDSGREP
ncbi:MAG: tRNA pseudouridine(38-40) synthase TruA [Gemmatimonadetes bacterium]|nr:tRNA pseudouridine(38-40) synthase TruA [Gemmatimonadota bacterium]